MVFTLTFNRSSQQFYDIFDKWDEDLLWYRKHREYNGVAAYTFYNFIYIHIHHLREQILAFNSPGTVANVNAGKPNHPAALGELTHTRGIVVGGSSDDRSCAALRSAYRKEQRRATRNTILKAKTPHRCTLAWYLRCKKNIGIHAPMGSWKKKKKLPRNWYIQKGAPWLNENGSSQFSSATRCWHCIGRDVFRVEKPPLLT